MKQSVFLRIKEVFRGSGIVRKFAFRTMDTRDNCAHMAKIYRHFVMEFAIIEAKSARFQKDCFECLSLHKIAA